MDIGKTECITFDAWKEKWFDGKQLFLAENRMWLTSFS